MLLFLLLFFRSVYERADKSLRNAEEKEERVMVLEAWKEFEVFIDEFIPNLLMNSEISRDSICKTLRGCFVLRACFSRF